MANNRIIIELLVRDERFRRNLREGQRGLNQFAGSANVARTALRGLGAVVGGVAFGKLATDSARVIANFQDFRSNLQFLTASARDYAEVQEYLNQTSQDYSARLDVVRASAVRLFALERSGVLTRRENQQVLEGILNATRLLGLNTERQELVFYGLGQALTQGTVQAQELNQVIEPMPGFLQELDRAAGLPANGFRNLVKQGLVTSDLFKDVLIAALEAYQGAAQRMAGNLRPTFNRLADSYQELQEALEQPVSVPLIAIMERATAQLETLRANVQAGIGFDALRVEVELWAQSVQEGVAIANEELGLLTGASDQLNKEVGLLARSALNFPINWKAAVGIMIGEGDKLLARISAVWQRIELVISSAVLQAANTVNQVFTQIVAQAQKPLDGLAGVYREFASKTPMLTMSYHAAMATIEYSENGRQYEEIIIAVIEDWGPVGAGMWGNKGCMYIRAPKGELEQWAPLLETIHTSVVIDTQWLIGELKGQQRRGAELIEVQQQIQNIDKDIAAHRQKTNVEIQNDMYLTLTEQEEYVNPYTNEIEIGTNQWDHRWQNNRGEIIYTDNEDYDPNTDINLNVSGFRRSAIRKR